jgi:hypothetical protein
VSITSAERVLQKRAPNAWISAFARAGYVTKGLVYLLVSVLALEAAASGGRPSGEHEAVRELAKQPFGDVLLVLVGIGLIGYASWRLVEGIFDPDREGTGLKGVFVRLAHFVSSFVHGALGIVALQLASGEHVPHEQSRTWAGKVLEQPYGWLLLVAVGIGVMITGAAQFVSAITGNFCRELDLPHMSASERSWAVGLGRFGLFARGVVFGIIGWFLTRVALTFDTRHVKGLGGALREVQTEAYGPLLLGIVAAGLAAHGIYMLVCARYRRVGLR